MILRDRMFAVGAFFPLYWNYLEIFSKIQEKLISAKKYLFYSIYLSTCLLGTAFFNAQTIREIKIENRKLGGKKRVSSVFTQYVCLCVCVCVCLSVIALQTSPFNIGVWNFNIDTYMKISQSLIYRNWNLNASCTYKRVRQKVLRKSCHRFRKRLCGVVSDIITT